MARRGWRWGAALLVVAALTLTGCSVSMDTADVQRRLVEATNLNGALVEVQHPDAPWNNKIVIWMFVDDDAPEAVAGHVRAVAEFADADGSLSGQDLTFFVVKGKPADFPERWQLATAGSYVMAKVAAIVGGKGAEDNLKLSAADVHRLAAR